MIVTASARARVMIAAEDCYFVSAINNNNNTYYCMTPVNTRGADGRHGDGLDRYERQTLKNGEHITSGHKQGDNLAQSKHS